MTQITDLSEIPRYSLRVKVLAGKQRVDTLTLITAFVLKDGRGAEAPAPACGTFAFTPGAKRRTQLHRVLPLFHGLMC